MHKSKEVMMDKRKKNMVILIIIAIIIIIKIIWDKQYKKLETEVLGKLGLLSWYTVSYFDEYVTVKSRQTLEKYDDIKFFKDNREKLVEAEKIIKKKSDVVTILNAFLRDNEYKTHLQYHQLTKKISEMLKNATSYRIKVTYISSAGNNLGMEEITLNQYRINKFRNDPSLLMTKSEYNNYLKEQQKELLDEKHHVYYKRVNDIIDYANANRVSLVIKDGVERLDMLVSQLFDRTVNSIKKIKTTDSEEWEVIGKFIAHQKEEIEKLVNINKKVLAYYESSDFLKIKETCEVLMSTQREFNEYIIEKVQMVSRLFGTRVVRNETINADEYNYIRPYKKTVTPFTAEVSATVFASAENNPLEYVVKNFYPNKSLYPEQILKLYSLVEELETLKDAKRIIENYKAEYQQYIGEVPQFIMEHDESGFYSKLGFANIDERVFAVEYKFSYTSGGGMAQRTFTVPMTEETIAQLIKVLESKLTASAFAREQRNLMTTKLRESIKRRDDFTCRSCGNSIYKESNLLLEIDHIIPVAKGGCTVEENLQTLCWKCNRSKGDKIIT